ncbi:MAG: anaerobic ribonucleoside-triphosphate reductase activating protein [Clostridiales bacterium]|nr:anaerobic ribonucleoside-triphosphate reductase activating protein [Clostridiales bacterium]
MRYHNITKDDMLNGDGLRVVLWVSGCSHHCEGCHNQITWDPAGGILFDKNAQEELAQELQKDYVSGITFSGGDPLFLQNRETIASLVHWVHSSFPTKTIWLYTGYCFEEIQDISFLPLIDVLVDGKFEKELYDPNLAWKGSSNQRVIDIKKTFETGHCVLRQC